MSAKPLRIDFVSDIACPWCAVGLSALEQALARSADAVQASVHLQPFELNPQMPPGGQDVGEHLAAKYGSTPEQQAQIRDTIRQRGAEAGFAFHPEGRGRIYNTFDAHRLLHWAGLQGEAQQRALKRELLAAYHGRAEAIESHDVLQRAAEAAGLDGAAARAVLDSGQYADEVRAAEQTWLQAGIHSVPSVVVNQRYLISGGQPAEVFEQALRKIAQEA